jgi:hypothetical protein
VETARLIKMQNSRISLDKVVDLNCYCDVSGLFRLTLLSASFLLICFLLLSQAVSAQSLEKYNEVAGSYLGYALLNPPGEIIKPVGKNSMKFWPTCIGRNDAKECSATAIEQKLNRSLSRIPGLKMDFSFQDADLRIIFGDNSVVTSKITELDQIYSAGYRDSADSDCALYYNVKESVVSKRVILVSLDSSALKQEVCLAVQFFQSLGLSFRNQEPFFKLWQPGPDALSTLTEEEAERLLRGLTVFALIHMCPEMRVGMKQDAVIAVLRTPRCWHGLYVK